MSSKTLNSEDICSNFEKEDVVSAIVEKTEEKLDISESFVIK